MKLIFSPLKFIFDLKNMCSWYKGTHLIPFPQCPSTPVHPDPTFRAPNSTPDPQSRLPLFSEEKSRKRTNIYTQWKIPMNTYVRVIIMIKLGYQTVFWYPSPLMIFCCKMFFLKNIFYQSWSNSLRMVKYFLDVVIFIK